jgi:predicted RNA-binding Zn ribbon-like protein
MSPTARPGTAPASAAYFIADHAALDFLNSVVGAGDAATEFLASDADVLHWLAHANLLPDFDPAIVCGEHAGSLSRAAVGLRDLIRPLIEQRKAGVYADPAPLNRILARGSAFQQLVWDEDKAPKRVLHQRCSAAEDLLVPVAGAIAELIESAQFDLVRKCENPACTLWFLDRTKSHRRRWCSMAICGNRNKAATFRARQRDGGEDSFS